MDIRSRTDEFKRLLPKLEERITYNVAKRIIDVLHEEVYPPEDMIKKEFIKSVKIARKGKGKTFKNKQELEKYLKGLRK